MTLGGRSGIRGRLAAVLVLLSTLPALLLGLYGLRLHLATLETLALDHLQNNVALLKERLDGFLSLAERDVRSVGDSFLLQRYLRSRQDGRSATVADREAAVKLFLGCLTGRPAYYRLRFLDGRGDEMIKVRKRDAGGSEEALPPDLRPGIGAYYLYRAEDAAPDQLLVFPGEVRAESDDGRVVQVITLLLPVTAESGEFRGLLILELLARDYFEIVEGSGLPPHGTVAVADREGHYLYHSRYRRDWNLLLASRSSANVHGHYPAGVASRILSGEPGWSPGSDEIVRFVPLRVGSDVPYVLFYAVRRQVLFSSLSSFKRLFAGVLLAAAFAAALLAALVAKRLTDPIRTLRSGAAVLASGDLSHRIRLRTGDEVEELARGFNAMAEALQEREVHLEALRDYQEDIVKSLNDGILVLDRDLTVRAFNPALSRMTGVPAERAMGRRLKDVFPAPEADALMSSLEGARAGQVVESEALLPGATRDLVTAELCLPMRNKRGETTGVILRATDITARRAAERALLDAKSTLQTIFDGIKAGIRLVSADHHVLAANAFHEKLLGRPAAEMVGEHCYATFGEGAVCTACPGNAAMRSLRPEEREFERRLQDGRALVLQVDAYPLSRAGERPWGFIEFIQDISEKRRLERELERHANDLERMVGERTDALRVSEERYRDLVENAPEMIHVLSPEGSFLHANRTERDKLGFALRELQGMSLADLVPPGEQRKLARHRREVASGGGSRVETVFLPRRGEPIDVEMDATGQFDEAGRLIQIRAFVRDVTDRKRMEQKLFETEKMVAVGQLASGIAHEIGTPLNAISGTAEFLLMSGSETVPGREELESIVAQARRISRLVQQLLDFSRRSRPRRVRTDAHELLRATLHLLQRPLASAGIRVELYLEPSPVRLKADPHQLQQVFANIVLNAQQAMPSGGCLRIETREDSKSRPPRLEMAFEDCGPGIPEENLRRIFEPFFTTKEVGTGTGLGLAICDGIVRQHRGTIRAENAPGGGARFVLDLPMVR